MKILVQSSEEAVALCRSLVSLTNRIRLWDLDEFSFAKTEKLLCGLRDAVQVEKPVVSAAADKIKEVIIDLEDHIPSDTSGLLYSIYEQLGKIVEGLEGSE